MKPTTRLWLKRIIKLGNYFELWCGRFYKKSKHIFPMILIPALPISVAVGALYFMDKTMNDRYENASLDAISNLVNSSECAKNEILIINRAKRVVKNYDISSIKKECKQLAEAKIALEKQNALLSPIKD